MYPNNYYPQPNYQNMYQQNKTSEIQYVNGIESAKAYQLMPNQTVLLMDSTQSRFYVKSSDASGFSTVRSYDFSETKEEVPKEYVTRSELEQFKTELTSMLEKNKIKRSALNESNNAGE